MAEGYYIASSRVIPTSLNIYILDKPRFNGIAINGIIF